MRLSEFMRRSGSGSADPDEAREKIDDLTDYLEANKEALEATCGQTFAHELEPLLRRLNSAKSILEIIADSGGP